MAVELMALIVLYAAIAVVWWAFRYGLPYLTDRDDALPDGAVSSIDILDRVAAEDAVRTDSWALEPSHHSQSEPYIPEQAHTEVQRHCECRTDLCVAKYQAFWTLVDAGHAVPDASAVR
ncbi:hypothetical protein OG874_23520 [Nocardia sp. NBC_00565]|uniref:hypothetical protein n=1 Tax=Nocardia sp. NBC_00565 TaxID=2975993 RepID=UPI002E81E349|nr:hypothetical protein [Nocardia sp. NBC_00565]WUB99889.1 hypothetical protein OG874_23520 [Nocardia sp. NBC_00565]